MAGLKIDEAFRAKIVALLPAGYTEVPVQKGKISATQPETRIQFDRATEDQETFLDGSTVGLGDVTFDVEIQALSDDDTQAIVAGIKGMQPAGLNAFRGLVSGIFIHGIFTGDHGDQYQPRLLSADEGFSVATFQAQVIFDEPTSEQ